jgi:hypothetical protein
MIPGRRAARLLKYAAFGCGLLLIWSWGVAGVRHLAANLVASYLLIWCAVFAISSAPRRELASSLLVTTIAIAICVLVLESLSWVRVVDYRNLLAAQHKFPWLTAGNRYDEELLYLREPGLVRKRVRLRGNIADSWCLPGKGSPLIVDLAYDDHGFRNPATLSRADIAFIGDSYIEAVQTPLESTLPQRVASSTGLTVANLGLSGYGPQQELAVLERYALPLEPGVIVWAFYEGNDLADLQVYDELRPKIGNELPTAPRLIDRTFSKNLLSALYLRLKSCEPSPKAQVQAGIFRDGDRRETTHYFNSLGGPLSAAEMNALTRFESIFARAHEQAVARGVRLILLFVPTKFRVYHDLVRFPEDSPGTRAEPNDLPQRLAALASHHSPPLEILDLTDAFRSAAALGEHVYLADDSHWTPTGHRIAAAALEDLLAH